MADTDPQTPETTPEKEVPPQKPAADPQLTESVKKLEKNNRALMEDLRKSQARGQELETKLGKLAEIAKALGAPDPTAADPEKVKATLEAEARAKREKSDKVKDALTMALLTTGRKFTPDAVRLIQRGAEDHPAITFDESGNVAGVEPYLESVFGLFGGDAGDRKTPSPPPPGKPGASGGGGAKKYTTIAELDSEGPQAVLEFERKFPDEYAALKAAHNATLIKPRRQMMPSPAPSQR